MAEVVLFHHVLGLTPGVDAFAAELGRHGHVVHTPDLFDGRTFPDIDAGIAFLDEPFTEFADRWPERVPVQIHGMDGDPFFAGEGDLDAARALVDHAAATT
ncbi:MAG: dienelactone hydrolase, partial [Acidobacteriota bacterium]